MDVEEIIAMWKKESANSNKYIKLIGKVAVNYISTHQEEADKITADLTLNGCMDRGGHAG